MKSLFAILASTFASLAAPAVAKQTDIVAAVLWAEARGEGDKGIRAVAEVIRNRSDNPKYGRTAYEVVTQHRQFSCLIYADAKKLVAIAKHSGGEDKVAWRYCHFIAQQLMERKFASEEAVRGATHFFSGRHLPNWARELDYVCMIGEHRFYK